VNRSPSESQQQGLAAFRAGELEQAIQLFDQARSAFAAQGEPGEAAEAANNLSVALLMAERPGEAREAVQGTAEVFLRLGDERRAAQAFGNLASALEACGDLPAAESAYREAVRRFDGLGDQESRSVTLKALSALQMKDRRPLEAANTLQSAGGRPGLRLRLTRFLLRLLSRLPGR
jgi:tetratricopeptide (TPR) repeat protein